VSFPARGIAIPPGQTPNSQDKKRDHQYREPVLTGKMEIGRHFFFPTHRDKFSFKVCRGFAEEMGFSPPFGGIFVGKILLFKDRNYLPLPSLILAKYILTSQITCN
jgi:hypothetical protein